MTIDTVKFQKIDHVWGKVVTEDYGIYEELSEYFSFRVPGFQYTPAYKSGRWDGIIRLFNKKTKKLHLGLWGELKKFCESYDYEFVYERERPEHTKREVLEYLRNEEKNLPFPLRDSQWSAIPVAILSKRRTIISPTGSGKSVMIYETAKFLGLRTLLIVPKIGLVHQMESDFRKYGYEELIQKIHGGKEKEVQDDVKVVISTWQSLTKLDEEWFQQFEVVLVDETHGAKANEMRKILEKCTQARYRIGFTGTLNDEESDRLVVQGLLGPVYRAAYTHELIEKDELSQFDVRVVVLKYPQSQRKSLSKMSYAEEIDYLVSNSARNRLIINMVLRLKRATLVLTRRISQLEELVSILEEKTDRSVYVIRGGVAGEERERIRQQLAKEKDPIVVATVETMSTGVDVPNLKYILMASPLKAKIPLLQSIGRVLRLSEGKTRAIFFDLVDDFSWKKKKNFSYQHLLERVRIYREEKHKFSLWNMEFSNDETS